MDKNNIEETVVSTDSPPSVMAQVRFPQQTYRTVYGQNGDKIILSNTLQTSGQYVIATIGTASIN